MLAFLGSMIWMDVAADEVVAITVALGTIFNIDSTLVSGGDGQGRGYRIVFNACLPARSHPGSRTAHLPHFLCCPHRSRSWL